jgi:hypothetical protein
VDVRSRSTTPWCISGRGSRARVGSSLHAMVALTIVRSEAEAEMLCGMLRANGITCGHRQTNVGAGAADGFPGVGPLEVFVAEGDTRRARELLGATGLTEAAAATRRRGRPGTPRRTRGSR